LLERPTATRAEAALLPRPPYIPADISRPEIRYPWDEWNVSRTYQPADPELLRRLTLVTHRAQVGLTIATMEWITSRYDALTTETFPSEYLEAAWAANVDLAYAEYIETDDEEWRGPILGPLNIGLKIVVESLFLADQIANPALHPCWAYKLACLVLPETTAFKAWHNDVVSRLEEYYRALPEDAQPLFSADGYVMDPPVARETFNPDVPFNPESAAVLIDRYLRALNYEENRFLRTPEDLQEMEFEGHPYRFPPNPPQPGEGA